MEVEDMEKVMTMKISIELFGTSFDAETLPERRLLLAVLQEAILNYVRYRDEIPGVPPLKTSRRGRQLSAIERWFLSNEVDWPFSFVGICESLKLNPDYLRDGIMNATTPEALEK